MPINTYIERDAWKECFILLLCNAACLLKVENVYVHAISASAVYQSYEIQMDDFENSARYLEAKYLQKIYQTNNHRTRSTCLSIRAHTQERQYILS